MAWFLSFLLTFFTLPFFVLCFLSFSLSVFLWDLTFSLSLVVSHNCLTLLIFFFSSTVFILYLLLTLFSLLLYLLLSLPFASSTFISFVIHLFFFSVITLSFWLFSSPSPAFTFSFPPSPTCNKHRLFPLRTVIFHSNSKH